MTINYLKDHGLSYFDAVKYRLGIVNPAEPADNRFNGMLSIPYLTPSGNIVGIKFRCTEPHNCKEIPDHAKYGAPSGQEPAIFNPQAFFEPGNIIGVAEGEIDAIVATERLGVPTIGIPGVEIWQQNKKIWRHALNDDYDVILVFADGDRPTEAHPEGAGLEFARSVVNYVGGAARVVRCPLGEDVASMVASGKEDILRERAGL